MDEGVIREALTCWQSADGARLDSQFGAYVVSCRRQWTGDANAVRSAAAVLADMSAEALAAFGEVVVDDAALYRELLGAGSRESFVALVVRRANERGWDVAAGDVHEGLRASRRAWQERWF